MLLRVNLLITLICVVVQTKEQFAPCNGNCVPYRQCLPIQRYYVVPMCSEDLVCCPVPKERIYTTRSERACHAYSNDRSFCSGHLLLKNGTEAHRNEFQYMASIGMQNETMFEPLWICGGTLIHSRYVLTAAHCIQIQRPLNTPEPDFFVRLGAHNFVDGIQYKVVRKFFHPDRQIDGNLHDIAILELNKTVIFNEKIRPACLPTSDIEGDTLTVSGWGDLDSHSTKPRQLNKASLRILDISECSKGQPNMHICAGGIDNITDTCQGDSGGPLARWHPTWGSCLGQVVGIVSGGDFCSADFPRTKFTKVFTYLKWIEDRLWPSN